MNTRTANQASISILLSTTLFLSSCDLFGNSTLSSIAVTPETPWVAIGATRQMVATATHSDGSTKNVSRSASWTSSHTETAKVSSKRVRA